ncbi:MAG: alpha-glucosidase/alpha-galactosidase, partial [Ruthenibacterium sp.]
SGEEGILLIKALCGLESVVSNVNVSNTNHQIANLPTDTIVETNALFRRDSIQPVAAGNVPPQIHALLAPHVENHTLILKAASECNFDDAFTAFMMDPLVAGRISPEEGRTLLREMLVNTKKYLPQAWNL